MTSFCGGPLAFLLIAIPGDPAAARFDFPGQTITAPDGFEVEVAAGPPMVGRPITADFDEEGRLYVGESSGSNEKVEKQLEAKPHRILRLEDVDGDGRFDRSTVFADRMMFPEGTMWLAGSLYVAAPPSIWKLTDSDGDGVAERREEWFEGKTLTGCANDLHGPYLGPDGWIYWCKGAFARQTYPRAGRPPLVTRAAHIFRRSPDAPEIEPVMTGGMDNPVDAVFLPGGEIIFTTTFFQHPEGGKRDGLIHALYGGVYGKVHDVIEEHPRTGEVMPVLTHLGPAAPCGLARYASRAFGPEFEGNLFSALFNLHKVMRHVLEPEGSSFRSRDLDFLASDSTDFHPTDVLEDADGSLLVIDTGGWYKLCCPTSQLPKPDVLGAIYRVRKRGAPPIEDPRGLRIPWDSARPRELARLLGDERHSVQARAVRLLGATGSEGVAALREVLSKRFPVETRRNAVWALTRLPGDAAREAARAALGDSDVVVRQAAIHSAGLLRDGAAREELLGLLQSSSDRLRRGAAEALGRIGDGASVPALLDCASMGNDRALEHSIIYALIEIGDRARTAAGLQARSPSARRAALIALDQMPGGDLGAEAVKDLLAGGDPLLRETAAWILDRHPGWGGTLAGHFRERLDSGSLADPERGAIERQLARLARDGAVQDLLVSTLGSAGSSDRRLLALRVMARANLKEAPEAWASGLARCLADPDPAVLRQAAATARSLAGATERSPELAEALLRLSRDRSISMDLRLDALAALRDRLRSLEAELFALLTGSVNPESPVAIRSTAVEVLTRAKLSPEQLLSLADSVKAAGPLEVSRLLSAFENSTDEALGLRLVEALKESAGLSGLPAGTLRARLAKFPPSVQERAQELLVALDVDPAREKAHLDELASTLKGGDLRRGQAVFNSQKAACSACHAIGYLGGKVGPDLTTIGKIRNERDLLESLIYPSASFTRSYEPVLVITRSRQVHNGILKQDSSEEVLLATGPGTEVRIAREDISEMQPGTVSVMPQGLEKLLSAQELADLLAFLKATQW